MSKKKKKSSAASAKIRESYENRARRLGYVIDDDDDDDNEKKKKKEEEEQEQEETDRQRELRFNELREARRRERLAHPEKYPPTQYWWDPSQPRRCHYFPSDLPTEEEVAFYEWIAYEYLGEGEVYRFHTYDCFLAYNRWSLEELDRWNDYLEFGHVHSLTETLEQWKAHTTDEHHLHRAPNDSKGLASRLYRYQRDNKAT